MAYVDKLREIAKPRSEEAINKMRWRRITREIIREEVKREFIEKACMELKTIIKGITYRTKDDITEHYDIDEFIEDFKKAMEE